MTETPLLTAEAAGDTEAASASAAATEGKTQEAADPAKAAAEGDGKGGAADDKAGDGKDKDGKAADDKAEAGAPEAYESFKLPDGMELDSKRLEAFTPLAKELNLDQANAQKLVDFYAEAVKAQTEAQVEAWASTQKEWRTATENDKEIGGKNLSDNLQTAKAALKEFGSPAFVELMESYGLGNHVEVIRFLSKVGKNVLEDGMMPGRSSPASQKTQAERIFTNPSSKPA